MRISDWSSDVCSSDLFSPHQMERSILDRPVQVDPALLGRERTIFGGIGAQFVEHESHVQRHLRLKFCRRPQSCKPRFVNRSQLALIRSEEHTSELQSLMRISYAVFCLKKKKTN